MKMVTWSSSQLANIPLRRKCEQGALTFVHVLTTLRNNKSIFIAVLERSIKPLEIPLPKGGEAFWLDARTVAHVVKNEDSKESELYTIFIRFENNGTSSTFTVTATEPVLVGTMPTTSATNFRYVRAAGLLIFSDTVFPDGDFRTVKEQDEAWQNRGTSALVYDSPYERYVLT